MDTNRKQSSPAPWWALIGFSAMFVGGVALAWLGVMWALHAALCYTDSCPAANNLWFVPLGLGLGAVLAGPFVLAKVSGYSSWLVRGMGAVLSGAAVGYAGYELLGATDLWYSVPIAAIGIASAIATRPPISGAWPLRTVMIAALVAVGLLDVTPGGWLRLLLTVAVAPSIGLADRLVLRSDAAASSEIGSTR